MRISRIFLVLAAFACPLGVQAIKVPGLYEVEIPVRDQSEAARNEGLQTAFRRVLIKLTGDRQAAARTSIQPIFARARDYPQAYRYREVVPEQVNEEG